MEETKKDSGFDSSGSEIEPMETVKMKTDVRSLFEQAEDEGVSENKNVSEDGGEVSFEEKLFETDPFIHPKSPFVDKVVEPRVDEDVFGAFESKYEPPEGEEKKDKSRLPWGVRPSIPWPGQKLDIWTDGKVAVIGRAAEIAFKRTREECMRRARLQGSPYRKAGLSRQEAAEEERNRIEHARWISPPDFESALPETPGERIERIGYVCRLFKDDWVYDREAPQGKFDGLETLFRRGDQVVSAPARKVKLALQHVKAARPLAERRGVLEFRQGNEEETSLWNGDESARRPRKISPIEIHIRGKSLRSETKKRIEEHAPNLSVPDSLFGIVMPTVKGISREGRERMLQRVPEEYRTGSTSDGSTSAGSTSDKKSQRANKKGEQEEKRAPDERQKTIFE
jgi:hypothetical protein